MNASTIFQFHIGTIKSSEPFSYEVSHEQFQFHIGTIDISPIKLLHNLMR